MKHTPEIKDDSLIENIVNLQTAILRIFRLHQQKGVSSENLLAKGYYFNIREKVSPDNLLNTAFAVPEYEKCNEGLKERG